VLVIVVVLVLERRDALLQALIGKRLEDEDDCESPGGIASSRSVGLENLGAPGTKALPTIGVEE
jgi:hypothetical protein